MRFKTTISSLDHEDLVNLFSTAMYGNDMFHAEWEDEFDKYTKDQECYEDKLANILLNGGEVIIYDLYADDTDEVYGKQGETWVSTSVDELTRRSIFGTEDFECLGYHITLQTLINGMNKSDRATQLAHTLFVDEEGDMITAEVLLQLAVYGEEIYG